MAPSEFWGMTMGEMLVEIDAAQEKPGMSKAESDDWHEWYEKVTADELADASS